MSQPKRTFDGQFWSPLPGQDFRWPNPDLYYMYMNGDRGAGYGKYKDHMTPTQFVHVYTAKFARHRLETEHPNARPYKTIKLKEFI